jgi:hypothetical protein
MAEPKKPKGPNGAKGLQEDEVVARLVPDAADPPDVVAMIGFLGRSARRGFWRLYHTLDLKNYVEIAEEDIVHSQSLTNELQHLGGTVIWIKSGARLKYSRSESGRAEAGFMQGEITRGFLSGTGTEGLTPRGGSNALSGGSYIPCTHFCNFTPPVCCSRRCVALEHNTGPGSACFYPD